MKSRKVKSYNSKKKFKADLPLSDSDSDPNTSFHDDIDDFSEEENNNLLTDDELIYHSDQSSKEEEVLPITDDENEESDDNKDVQSDDDIEKDLPNPDAWGKKKFLYYAADFVDEDKGRAYREDDEAAARAEAEEALAIQKSMYSNATVDNLGCNLFLEEPSESSGGEEEEINLLAATTEEKRKYVMKKHPHLQTFILEYKAAVEELNNRLIPLYRLTQEGKMKSEVLIKYITDKQKCLLLYCSNICFYMLLISLGRETRYHPVIKRIAMYKKFLDDYKAIDGPAGKDFDYLIKDWKIIEERNVSQEKEKLNGNMCQSSFEIAPEFKEGKNVDKSKKKSKRKHVETEVEKEILSFISEIKEQNKRSKDEESNEIVEDEPVSVDENEKHFDEKRKITYEIAKNKGLVPHRKKEYRNPRVRHRMKYRKAKIRRKGQVPGHYKEIKKYEGEPTGINMHVIKSIKFK